MKLGVQRLTCDKPGRARREPDMDAVGPRMRQIRTSGSMSGEGNPSPWLRRNATAPSSSILQSRNPRNSPVIKGPTSHWKDEAAFD